MGALSWVRLARRVPGVVRQQELANLEALMEAEAGRQPTRNLFVLSCAIPAGIATFGMGSVFMAWLSGQTGLPLALGTGLTAALSAGAWFTFYRLYRAVPPATRKLRDQISRLSRQYGSFGNIFLGESAMSVPFAARLDEAAGIYLRHGFGRVTPATEASVSAIESAMAKLLEVAMGRDRDAQNLALAWADPILEEMRRLDRSLVEHALAAKSEGATDPLASLRSARAELETANSARQELDRHLGA